jgi:trafficking protein particle complex subunit 5
VSEHRRMHFRTGTDEHILLHTIRLSLLGYRVGQRVLPLLSHRIEFPTPPSLSSGSSTYNRNPKRETRLLPVLLWLHTQLWKALFGKPADSLERSTEKEDECEL